MATRFAPLTPDDPPQAGRYTLRARLGAGGMGRVYLAFSPGGRALAIKVIRPEHAENEEFRRRFQQEVTAARRVQGLYTAPVVDADPNAPLPWLATAYVPGPSLRHAVAEHGPLPLPTVFRLLAGVAEGLTAVHAAGIIHRDLTPANVLLAEDGPRVIDFGIAHAAEATSLTRTGLKIGTPAYMAPEQIRGQAATFATDVHSLGNLAVFAATGHPAFGEGNEEAMLYRIVYEPPDLTDCPPEVRAIAQRCLAKEPGERPSLVEIMEYSRAQTHGQTMRLAMSWLPNDSYTTYSPSGYQPRPATMVATAPPVVTYPPPVWPAPRQQRWSASAGIAVTLGVIGVVAALVFLGLAASGAFSNSATPPQTSEQAPVGTTEESTTTEQNTTTADTTSDGPDGGTSLDLAEGDCVSAQANGQRYTALQRVQCGTTQSDLILAMTSADANGCAAHQYLRIGAPDGSVYCFTLDLQQGDCVDSSYLKTSCVNARYIVENTEDGPGGSDSCQDVDGATQWVPIGSDPVMVGCLAPTGN